jgi:hypothetical protein
MVSMKRQQTWAVSTTMGDSCLEEEERRSGVGWSGRCGWWGVLGSGGSLQPGSYALEELSGQEAEDAEMKPQSIEVLMLRAEAVEAEKRPTCKSLSSAACGC